MWYDYVHGKQTYRQLALRYNCSLRTIQRRIDGIVPNTPQTKPNQIVVLMDTTYFGRNVGVMLFKDALTGRNLLVKHIKYETNQLYLEGIQQLKENGYEITAIVCDGRRGLFNLFEDIPVQMCQFHQVSIITRYLTKKPKLEASKELKELTQILVKTDKESFTGGLQSWFEKWQKFLDERSIDSKTKKSYYTHKKLRSAYRSLKNNMPYLFTWYDNLELRIPNTTNAIDGHFAALKNKLRNHNGLSITRKKKFINEFFEV